MNVQRVRSIRSSDAFSAVWPPLAVLFGFGLIWHAAATWGGMPPFVLPSPAAVLAAGLETRGALLDAVRTTLFEVGVGLVIALLLGVAIATALAGSSFMRRALSPLLVASQTVPILAVAPLLVIWFGFGILPKVAVVVLVCVFPIAISTAQGLTSADPGHIALLRSMGASRVDTWRLRSHAWRAAGVFCRAADRRDVLCRGRDDRRVGGWHRRARAVSTSLQECACHGPGFCRHLGHGCHQHFPVRSRRRARTHGASMEDNI